MAMADDSISNVSKAQKVGKILSALDIVDDLFRNFSYVSDNFIP